MITVHRLDEPGFQELAREWEDLLAAGPRPSVFRTWAWQHAWWRHFRDGKQLRLYVARDDAGALVGIAPLCLAREGSPIVARTLRFLGTERVSSEYLDILLRPGTEEVAADALLRAIESSVDWDVLALTDLDEEAAALRWWKPRLEAGGFDMDQRVCQEIPYLALPRGADAVSRLWSASMRYTVARKTRKIASVGYERRVLSEPAALTQALERLFELHGARWRTRGRPGNFMDERVRSFHRELASTLGREGAMRIGVLSRSDRAVAMLYTFERGGVASYYQAGFEPEVEGLRPSEYSPGLVLLGKAIEDAADQGFVEFDFLRGDETYKDHWTKTRRFTWSVTAIRPGAWPERASIRWSRGVRAVRSRARQLLRPTERPRRSPWPPSPEPATRRWIKDAAFSGYAHLVRPIPRGLRAALGAQRVVVLCYHRVNDEVRDPLTVGVAQFEEQMRLLASSHPLVSIEDVVAGTVPRDTARPPVAVTFDDGYLDNWENGAPILSRLRIPAAFFVSTGLVGTGDGFQHDRARLGRTFPLMDWDQVRRLRDMGFTIGSHASTHVNLARVDLETVRRQLTESRDALRDRVGVERPILAYPYGRFEDITSEGLAMARELGFSGCLSSYGGANDGTIDPFRIRRQGINYAFSRAAFEAAAEGFHRADRKLMGRSPDPGEGLVSVHADDDEMGAPAARPSPPRRAGRRRVEEPPLVVHVIYHLLMGGLENGLVNLVNRIPPSRYRHVIVCMAHYDDFRLRITRPGVDVIAMRVRERGLGRVSRDLYALFRQLRPAIVHSRNLAGLDSLLPAALARVPYRIHGEHGWETDDLQGRNWRRIWDRRLHAPLVHRYVALSRHQERYLVDRIRIKPARITQIYNGVDVERFQPGERGARAEDRGAFVVGTVGRMMAVKDPLNLVEAFLTLRRSRPDLAPRVRLVMVGDGPIRGAVEARLREEGAEAAARLAGARNDVAEQLRGLDLFVLPSQAEGISNTILEAMATGLPVVATRVGGNPELVVEEATGLLVPASDPASLAAAIARYAGDPALAARHGAAGRERVLAEFNLDRMVARYTAIYDACPARRPVEEPVPDPTA